MSTTGFRALSWQLRDIKQSFRERGYAYHHRVDRPGRIWRNLYAEADEVFIALTPGLSLSYRSRIRAAEPFEEMYLDAGTSFDIIGSCQGTCHWVYGYEIAGTSVHTRLMRQSGVLLKEDWHHSQSV